MTETSPQLPELEPVSKWCVDEYYHGSSATFLPDPNADTKSHTATRSSTTRCYREKGGKQKGKKREISRVKDSPPRPAAAAAACWPRQPAGCCPLLRVPTSLCF